MCRHTNYTAIPVKSGFTLVEVLISLALLGLLSIITISGMMMHARMARSNMVQQQIAEQSRRFVDMAQVLALDATVLKSVAGPAGPNTVLTIGKPNPTNPSQILYKQYAYLDADNNPETIRDNRLVERDVNAPMATTGELIIDMCSPVPGTPIFELVEETVRPLYNINLRVGDRTSPPNSADNAVTGNGYQSFLITASISQL